MWQQIIIIGNVGREPEFGYTPQGVARCQFSVAVNKYTGRGEERKEETIWFRVTIWRDRAETASQIIKKGTKIMVVGEVNASAYLSKQTNQPMASLEITARDFQLLSPKPGSEGGGESRGGPSDGGKDGEDLPF